MGRRSGTGCVLDQDRTHALARDIRQLLVKNDRYLRSRRNLLGHNNRSQQGGGRGKEQDAQPTSIASALTSTGRQANVDGILALEMRESCADPGDAQANVAGRTND